jgi:hypothetical protein
MELLESLEYYEQHQPDLLRTMLFSLGIGEKPVSELTAEEREKLELAFYNHNKLATERNHRENSKPPQPSKWDRHGGIIFFGAALCVVLGILFKSVVPGLIGFVAYIIWCIAVK